MPARSAAEAFTSAAKHADASAVDILIEQAGDTLTVQVRDDGAGGADASRGTVLTVLLPVTDHER
jgi:signal transduction histidine kinase